MQGFKELMMSVVKRLVLIIIQNPLSCTPHGILLSTMCWELSSIFFQAVLIIIDIKNLLDYIIRFCVRITSPHIIF